MIWRGWRGTIRSKEEEWRDDLKRHDLIWRKKRQFEEARSGLQICCRRTKKKKEKQSDKDKETQEDEETQNEEWRRTEMKNAGSENGETWVFKTQVPRGIFGHLTYHPLLIET